MLGNFTQNLDPHGLPADAQSFPPCNSIIERQIESPIPIP
jgi:hypothetical protein